MSTYHNRTESGLVKTGFGKLLGIIVNSHSSGTIKLVDGVESGVQATSTLTSGGAYVPATHAVSVLTANTVVATNVMVIGTKTYTAVAALTGAANEVLIGAGDAEFLANLKAAINGAAGAGTTYGVGTVAHTQVVCTASDATTLTVRGRVPGTSLNTVPTTGVALTLVWADTTLGGGTGASDAGVTTAGAQIVINGRTYTFVDALSETYGATAIADQILAGANPAASLVNAKKAINASGIAGTNYSTGTLINGDVFAGAVAATTLVITAIKAGTYGNAITTTENMANTSFTSTVMASGTGSTAKTIVNTITLSAVATTGERFIPFYDCSFSTGLYAVVGGTLDYTLLVD